MYYLKTLLSGMQQYRRNNTSTSDRRVLSFYYNGCSLKKCNTNYTKITWLKHHNKKTLANTGSRQNNTKHMRVPRRNMSQINLKLTRWKHTTYHLSFVNF